MNRWQDELHVEFERAAAARARNNEGQARVCARRAAGIAIRESLVRCGTHPLSKSSYDLLNLLREDPDLPEEMRLVVDHLTVRVTEEFKLPVDADLVTEARRLCKWLLPEWE